MAKQATDSWSSNDVPRNTIDPEKYAEALAQYESDKGLVDRANGQKRRHQNFYETEFGISAKEIRRRHTESRMTEAERLAQYAEEQVGRRALDLWSAESPEDFELLMERAAATAPAVGAGAEKLEKARAYNAGHNGAVHGNQTVDDNPYQPGDELHVEWDRGCRDGLQFKDDIGLSGELTRQAKAMEERGASPQPTADDPPKKRASRKKALDLLAENAEKLNGDVDEPVVNDLETEGLFSDLPAPPAMPD